MKLLPREFLFLTLFDEFFAQLFVWSLLIAMVVMMTTMMVMRRRLATVRLVAIFSSALTVRVSCQSKTSKSDRKLERADL